MGGCRIRWVQVASLFPPPKVGSFGCTVRLSDGLLEPGTARPGRAAETEAPGHGGEGLGLIQSCFQKFEGWKLIGTYN